MQLRARDKDLAQEAGRRVEGLVETDCQGNIAITSQYNEKQTFSKAPGHTGSAANIGVRGAARGSFSVCVRHKKVSFFMVSERNRLLGKYTDNPVY